MHIPSETSVEFFRQHVRGSRAHATLLAGAVLWAADGGYGYEWIKEAGEWACILWSPHGVVSRSIPGLALTARHPWADPRRRVIEAELALEVMPS
jgi:hypothetical protein